MSSGYFENYISVLVFLLAVLLLTGVFPLIHQLSRRHLSTESAYRAKAGRLRPSRGETGIFNEEFVLSAIAFNLLQIATVLLYPWAAIFHELRMLGFLQALVFVSIASSGFLYFWRKSVRGRSGNPRARGAMPGQSNRLTRESCEQGQTAD